MATRTRICYCKALPMNWRCPDELWERFAFVLDELDPPAATGRKRIDQRKALDGLIYHARTGCQWHVIPREFRDYKIHSSHHATVGWQGRLRAHLVAPDRVVRRARRRGLGVAISRRLDGQGAFWGDQIGRNPTDRGNNGTKRSVIVDADGGPLGVVVAGANVHDTKLLRATIDAIIVERPNPVTHEQHLCLDKGYDNPTGHTATWDRHYTAHIRRIGEEKLDPKRRKRLPARRWVVERTFAWLSKWRGILVRYATKSSNYLASIQLACILLWYRRWRRLAF